MRGSKSLSPVLKLVVLIAAGCGLFAFWHWHPATTIAVPDDDDVKFMPRVRVSIGTIGRATLHRYVQGFGTVEPQPAKAGHAAAVASISAPTPAVVASVDCVEGQHVKAGDALFNLDVRAIDASIKLAQDRLAAAESNVKQTQKSLDEKNVRQIDLIRAQHERDLASADLDALVSQRATYKIVSPIAGTIMQLAIHPGEVASANAQAVQVVDLNRLVVATSIPSSQLDSIRIGQAAEIGEGAFSDRHPTSEPTTVPTILHTSVTFIDPGVDPRSNAGSVDVAVPVGAGLRPGETVSVRIVAEEHANCLAVPVESVAKDAQGNPSISMVERDFRWAVREPVTVGIREGNLVEISSPDLKGGEDIVTTGAYALPDKSMIEIIK